MSIVQGVRLGFFILKLMIEYGPTLVSTGRKIYRKVEEYLGGHKKEPDAAKRAVKKQVMFKDLLKSDKGAWVNAMGMPPTSADISTFREKIWERENWDKAKARRKARISGRKARRSSRKAARDARRNDRTT